MCVYVRLRALHFDPAIRDYILKHKDSADPDGDLKRDRKTGRKTCFARKKECGCLCEEEEDWYERILTPKDSLTRRMMISSCLDHMEGWRRDSKESKLTFQADCHSVVVLWFGKILQTKSCDACFSLSLLVTGVSLRRRRQQQVKREAEAQEDDVDP